MATASENTNTTNNNTSSLRPLRILFLGGAKRVSMARLFALAAARRGYKAEFFSYELNAEVPIACMATIILGKRWNDPDIQPDLERVVAKYGINILVPFVDGAVATAAEFARNHPEVFAPCGDPSLADRLFDKVEADALFVSKGLSVPEHNQFPLIAKPRRGSASKGLMIIRDGGELAALKNPDKYIIQRYVENREEYTVDCYVSPEDGKMICAVPRRRLEVLSGEVSETITFRDSEVADLAIATAKATGWVGAINVQLLRDLLTWQVYIMEVNPRLGGGAVCSVYAGADLPGYIIDGFLHRELKPCPDWLDGVKMCRYRAETVFYDGNILTLK